MHAAGNRQIIERYTRAADSENRIARRGGRLEAVARRSALQRDITGDLIDGAVVRGANASAEATFPPLEQLTVQAIGFEVTWPSGGSARRPDRKDRG